MEFHKLFIYLFTPCLFICLFIYSSISLFIHLFVCMSQSLTMKLRLSSTLWSFCLSLSCTVIMGLRHLFSVGFLVIRKFHILLHIFCILQWLDSMGRERLGINQSFQTLNDPWKFYSLQCDKSEAQQLDFRGMSKHHTPTCH